MKTCRCFYYGLFEFQTAYEWSQFSFMILTLQFSVCLVERVEVTVEVPAEGQSPPLHRVSPTLIPQVHLFNENNQKVGDVSYSNPIQLVLQL